MGVSLRKGNSYSENQVEILRCSKQAGRSALKSSKLASPCFAAEHSGLDRNSDAQLHRSSQIMEPIRNFV